MSSLINWTHPKWKRPQPNKVIENRSQLDKVFENEPQPNWDSAKPPPHPPLPLSVSAAGKKQPPLRHHPPEDGAGAKKAEIQGYKRSEFDKSLEFSKTWKWFKPIDMIWSSNLLKVLEVWLRGNLGGRTVWRPGLFLSGGYNDDNLRDNNNNDGDHKGDNVLSYLLAPIYIQSNPSILILHPYQLAFLEFTCIERQVGGCSGTQPAWCLQGCKSLWLSYDDDKDQDDDHDGQPCSAAVQALAGLVVEDGIWSQPAPQLWIT